MKIGEVKIDALYTNETYFLATDKVDNVCSSNSIFKENLLQRILSMPTDRKKAVTQVAMLQVVVI